MIYTYFILGTLCFILSGMWFGSICTDHYDGIRINTIQYAMTLVTFVTGVCQFFMIYKTVVL